MKKKLLLVAGLICAMAMVLTGCGKVKTEQAKKKLEVNKSYAVKALVTCDDEDAKIKLKDGGQSYTAEQLGDVDLTFVITKDDKEEEATYTYTVADTKAPTINSGKVKEIYAGHKFKTSKIYAVSDNGSADDKITVKVDTSGINTKKAGEYEFKVTATDEAGNTSEKTLTLTVKKDPLAKASKARIKKVEKQFATHTYFTYVGTLSTAWEFTDGRVYVRGVGGITNQGTYSIRAERIKIKYDNGAKTQLSYKFDKDGHLTLDTVD